MNALATRTTRKQSGIALIAFLFVLVTGTSFVLLRGLNAAATQAYRNEQTTRALAEAKAVLIGYAVSDPNRPGEIPCPDINDDGKLTLTVDFGGGGACISYRGWLPWNSLRLPDLRDAAGERLWYGLSDLYRAGHTAKLNSDVPGQLTVDGVNDVVAVVLAPFEPVGGKSRRPGTDTSVDVDKYLEGTNSDGDLTDYTSSGAGEFNDRLITITRRELMVPTERRVAGELSNVLRNYYANPSTSPSKYYPYASKFDDGSYTCTVNERHGRLPLAIATGCPALKNWGGTAVLPTWFKPNDWHTVTYYAVAPSCTNTTPGCTGAGLLTVNNSSPPVDNKQAVVVMTGQELAGQTRPSDDPTNYLEGQNAIPQNDVFERVPVSTTFNDVVTVVAP